MSKEITTISPEGLEVANFYLQFGNIRAVVEHLGVAENKVVDLLNKREVKKYIDTVYLDMGYRNKNNIASVLDEMIQFRIWYDGISDPQFGSDFFRMINFSAQGLRFNCFEISSQNPDTTVMRCDWRCSERLICELLIRYRWIDGRDVCC